MELTENLGMNVGTARGIIACGAEGVGLVRGGVRQVVVVMVVAEAVVVRLVQLVEDNPAYTLVRMREIMFGEGIVLCTSSIARALDKQLIRVKKLYDVPLEQSIEKVEVR